MKETLLKLAGTIGALCCFVGVLMVALYGYQLMFGTSLKSDTTYRRTETVMGREVDSHIFHTDNAEAIHHRLVKLTTIGSGLLVGGVVLLVISSVVKTEK